MSRFLLIDDDEPFTRVLSRALQRRGYEVLCVTDANDAVSAAIRWQPHYVVLDLRIDQASGLVLLTELTAQLTQAKVLMLTGYSSLATAVEAMKRGAFNYLAKPANLDAILRALELVEDEPVMLADEAAEVLSVDRMAWEHIQRVLKEEGGNISSTARRLGMHRRTLQRRLLKRAPREGGLLEE